jgi:hypothetical protein
MRQALHSSRARALVTAIAAVGIAFAILFLGSGSVPTQTLRLDATIPPASADDVSRNQAVAIARTAAGQIQRWLEDIPVSVARQGRFGDYRNEYAVQVSAMPEDGRRVWVIGLFDEGMGQGATVLVDAADGRVLQKYSYVR